LANGGECLSDLKVHKYNYTSFIHQKPGFLMLTRKMKKKRKKKQAKQIDMPNLILQ